jgi:arsenate reductase (thioredoxin)
MAVARRSRTSRPSKGTPATVLFACTHNAGRSQIAAALLNAMADPATVRAESAGTQPATHVHPNVVTVMREIGIDLGHVVPRLLTPAVAERATILVTMGCGEACPMVPGVRREDWPLPTRRVKPSKWSEGCETTCALASRG